VTNIWSRFPYDGFRPTQLTREMRSALWRRVMVVAVKLWQWAARKPEIRPWANIEGRRGSVDIAFEHSSVPVWATSDREGDYAPLQWL
jgi:hypothetical protein